MLEVILAVEHPLQSSTHSRAGGGCVAGRPCHGVMCAGYVGAGGDGGVAVRVPVAMAGDHCPAWCCFACQRRTLHQIAAKRSSKLCCLLLALPACAWPPPALPLSHENPSIMPGLPHETNPSIMQQACPMKPKSINHAGLPYEPTWVLCRSLCGDVLPAWT